MQFERMTLQEFTPGVIVTSEKKQVRTFVPQYSSKPAAEETNEPPPPPPPPTYSEAELQAARDDGYRKGFNDGEKQGLSVAQSEMAMVDQNIRELMQPLAEKLHMLFVHYDQFILAQKQSTPLLAGAIAKKIAGDALHAAPMANIEHKCIECIDQMLGEAEIHVYVHPSLSDALEDRLVKHFAQSHEPGNVLIHKDEALETSACRIEWKNGGLQYNPTNLMAQMDTLVLGIAGAEEHTHEAVTPENIADKVELPPLAVNESHTSETVAETDGMAANSAALEDNDEVALEAPSADVSEDEVEIDQNTISALVDEFTTKQNDGIEDIREDNPENNPKE